MIVDRYFGLLSLIKTKTNKQNYDMIENSLEKLLKQNIHEFSPKLRIFQPFLKVQRHFL